MEYINSRKRLIISRFILGNDWCLQYRVKIGRFGYTWLTVASCNVTSGDTVNKVIEYLEWKRSVYKWNNKGYTIEEIADAA